MSERLTDDWTEPVEPPLRGPVEAVYRFAEQGRGLSLLVAFALLESCGVPFPPDFLLAAFCIGAPHRTKRLVLSATTASVAGGAITYLTAPMLWEMPAVRSFADRYLAFAGFTDSGLRTLNEDYVHHGWWAAFFAGLKPAAFHAHAFTAGVFSSEEPLLPFLFASFLSHAFRFFMIAGVAAFFSDLLRPGTARRPVATFALCFLLWLLTLYWGLPAS